MWPSLRPAFDRLRQYQEATLTTRAAYNIAPVVWKNAMSIQHLRLFLVAGLITLPIALLSLPGAQWPTLFGAASAQEPLDIDYFYDQLDSYGDWVWHPRFGYVWLPQNVSENWRPYTVGHWVYTDEYGWYWDSHEPFAWAVYHYGRWGYDPDYGWFWVPGNTWAPAWVEWRYSDRYVGWAPVGPTRTGGYAYGVPVNYDPPVAESWVFVEPRYVTAPSIFEHSVPIPQLNVAFMSADTIYQPEYRAGAVFNFGIPRETVVRITNNPIVVQKIVRVQNQTNIYDEGGASIKVFAPSVSNVKTESERTPKRFVDTPSEFKPKAKLTATVEGAPPKGLGPTAATLKPIASEVTPEEFKKHVVHFGGNSQDQAPVGSAGQGQASTESAPSSSAKQHLQGTPALGGSQAPVGATGQGQASTKSGSGGPDKSHLKGTPALGGSQAPVGSAGQGQASTQNGSGGSDKSHLAGAPSGQPTGKHPKHPECAQHPELPVCKDPHQ
jgi:hypothetical protein